MPRPLNTTQVVDEAIELIDGASSNDDVVKKRWRRAVQRSVNFIWNDRPWAMKLRTTTFTYRPGYSNPMPQDFGGFESLGSGIYCRSPQARLRPMSIGELKMCSLGQTIQTQGLGPWTRWALDNENNVQSLKFWYEPPDEVTVDMVYLKRSPRCVYTGIDEGSDELYWIPAQWHELVKMGAEWLNSHQVASNQEETEQAFLKLGLDQMRDRADKIAMEQGLVPFRAHRMRAS